jgi:hypothetical protein
MKFHDLNEAQQSKLRAEWADKGSAFLADVTSFRRGIWLTWHPSDDTLDAPVTLLAPLKGGQGESAVAGDS